MRSLYKFPSCTQEATAWNEASSSRQRRHHLNFLKWIVWYDLPWSSQKKTGAEDMGVSENWGTPKWMVKIMEHPIKNGWFGGKTHYFRGNTHLERKMIFQTSMIMVHVNLPGCMKKVQLEITGNDQLRRACRPPVRWGEERWKKVGVPSIGSTNGKSHGIPPWQTNVALENHHFFLNRRYMEIHLLNGCFIHCHVSFQGCIFNNDVLLSSRLSLYRGSLPPRCI